MGKYKEIVYTLPEEREVMETLTDLTDTFVESVKLTHPQKYNSFLDSVKQLHSHHHFDDMLLKESRHHVHEHYTLVHSNKLAQEEFEVEFSKEPFNQYDFNFILNEMHKMYHNLYNDDVTKYAELALSWLDHNNGKAKKYYEKMYLTE